jgi:hypothetical protein
METHQILALVREVSDSMLGIRIYNFTSNAIDEDKIAMGGG